MKSFAAFLVALAATIMTSSAFSPTRTPSTSITTTAQPSSTALNMANENDLLRWARSARSAGVDDRLVELKRPLGIVLNEDANGNVYVETVAPRGNAARTGEVSSLLRYLVHRRPLCLFNQMYKLLRGRRRTT
mmetsp:Transcript_39170/g.80235  ORF Transcript_39170/g.80235 Transcript_39170/m.80235 type:complete len:133 (+) Transcript_39170:188-586(+)